VALLLLVACGPVECLSQVTRRAQTAVNDAREVEAQRYAPYEWESATSYLHKARELGGMADFEAAIECGRKAERFATEARRLALERAGTGDDRGATPRP
jgi:uncharacterized protein DUF4398